ncbi:MAG: prepilin-type N-terminal cleavage/methylation domain-containing protein [Planctomycetes bacterium]|nr:prepilin-type N-terminal cleavage/methylation domain-containing protein [Planctomycetota bacterium]
MVDAAAEHKLPPAEPAPGSTGGPAARASRPRPRGSGFTLLELVIAVTLLAAFILPMIQIIADSRLRAYVSTQDRMVRELAQQKLHERIHHYELEDAGTFEVEGKPDWYWEVDPPQMVGQSEQILLEYRIRVTVPLKLEGSAAAESGQGTTYEYTATSFPSERWYEEQQILYERGEWTILYGDPTGAGALYGGTY